MTETESAIWREIREQVKKNFPKESEETKSLIIELLKNCQKKSGYRDKQIDLYLPEHEGKVIAVGFQIKRTKVAYCIYTEAGNKYKEQQSA